MPLHLTSAIDIYSGVLNFTPRQHLPRERTTVSENCSLLSYYAASSGNLLLTFRDNLSVSSSGIKNLRIIEIWSRIQGIFPETSVRNHPHKLRNNLEERSSHFPRGGRLKPLTNHSIHYRGSGGGLQRRFGRLCIREKPVTPTLIRILDCEASSLFTKLSTLPRLLN